MNFWVITNYSRLIKNLINIIISFLDYPCSCFQNASITFWIIIFNWYFNLIRKHILIFILVDLILLVFITNRMKLTYCMVIKCMSCYFYPICYCYTSKCSLVWWQHRICLYISSHCHIPIALQFINMFLEKILDAIGYY